MKILQIFISIKAGEHSKMSLISCYGGSHGNSDKGWCIDLIFLFQNLIVTKILITSSLKTFQFNKHIIKCLHTFSRLTFINLKHGKQRCNWVRKFFNLLKLSRSLSTLFMNNAWYIFARHGSVEAHSINYNLRATEYIVVFAVF